MGTNDNFLEETYTEKLKKLSQLRSEADMRLQLTFIHAVTAKEEEYDKCVQDKQQALELIGKLTEMINETREEIRNVNPENSLVAKEDDFINAYDKNTKDNQSKFEYYANLKCTNADEAYEIAQGICGTLGSNISRGNVKITPEIRTNLLSNLTKLGFEPSTKDEEQKPLLKQSTDELKSSATTSLVNILSKGYYNDNVIKEFNTIIGYTELSMKEEEMEREKAV